MHLEFQEKLRLKLHYAEDNTVIVLVFSGLFAPKSLCWNYFSLVLDNQMYNPENSTLLVVYVEDGTEIKIRPFSQQFIQTTKDFYLGDWTLARIF